jgi:hypothetical protein
MSKRNCIFTNEISDAKLNIGSDKYNWSKSVPCTKKFLKDKGDRPLNELEFRLVELFYEQELCRLRIDHYDGQMAEIRALNDDEPTEAWKKAKNVYKEIKVEPLEQIDWENIEVPEFTEEDVAWLNAPLGPTEDDKFVGIKEQVEQNKELTEEKEPVKVEKKVVKKKTSLWD